METFTQFSGRNKRTSMGKNLKATHRERRALDRLFGRQMKSAQDSSNPMSEKKDVKKFVRKYKSCMCTKIKADMRNMWKLANCDFEMAASVLIAREHAYKETITEGEWLSDEQLTDVFKSAKHSTSWQLCNKGLPRKTRCEIQPSTST